MTFSNISCFYLNYIMHYTREKVSNYYINIKNKRFEVNFLRNNVLMCA